MTWEVFGTDHLTNHQLPKEKTVTQTHRRTTTARNHKGKVVTKEYLDEDNLSLRIEGHAEMVDGHEATIEIHMHVFGSWRFWRWVKVVDKDTGATAYSWWPIPYFPPLLFKRSLWRALDKVHPR